MNEQSNSANESTILHLNKFAGNEPAPSAAEAANAGMTVIMKRAAADAVEQGAKPVAPKDGGALPPDKMLGAVSYCYAKGVYESEEIERKMMKDPALRESVHGDVPDAKAIRRFRMLNRSAIQSTLERAFGLLRRKEKNELLKPLPGQPAQPAASDQLGESTVIIAKEQAAERVQQAAFVDNMSKE